MRRDTDAVRAALGAIDRAHQRRRLQVTTRTPRDGPAVSLGPSGERWINFCSNDYLGLSQHPEVIAAFREAAAGGVGSGAAHLLGGHSSEHRELERELAAWTGRERALLFSTGFMANLGVVPALAGRGDTVLQDRLNHASLLDAARLAGSRLLRYPHGDASAARRLLHHHPQACLLATDGVFSMDGDLAPLRELSAACAERQAWLLVDDAHGLGVLGAEGRGSIELAQLGAGDVPLLMGTLGKALGCFGAFIAGDDENIELLLQRSRTFLFTTATPPALAAAARAAVRIARSGESLRQRLHANIRTLREEATRRGIGLAESATAIQPLVIGDALHAVQIGERLRAEGFLVGVTRPPTVPPGTARLRITVSAAHEASQIRSLLDALDDALHAIPAPASRVMR